MKIIRLDSVDSTNDAAKRLIAEGSLTDDSVVTAREQTGGRGTQGRSWISPRDAGLYFSIVTLDAGAATPDVTLHTLAAGVGCAEVLSKLPGVQVRLKPVNDLIASGGKLGGILVESLVESGQVRALITGIGINTHQANREVAQGALPPISLEELMSSRDFALQEFELMTQDVVDSVRRWQSLVTTGDSEAVHHAWNSFQI